MAHNLKEYKPDYYDGILEMDVLLNAEQPAVDTLWRNLNTTDDPDPDNLPHRGIRDNQFIQTSDSGKLIKDEALYSIPSNPATESVAFRRQRLLNRVSTRPPFTEIWLRRQLDKLIGAGLYGLTVDHNAYIITIESAAADSAYYQEIAVTMARVKPCNMIFVYKPLITPTVEAVEEIYLLSRIYNYHVGTTWNVGAQPFSSYLNNPAHYEYRLGRWYLGAKPFATYNGELIKLASQPSIKQPVFTAAANVTAANIAKVRINGTLVITAFDLKEAIGSQVTIEYNVFASQIETITLVEVLDASNNVLTSSVVYVPVVLDVLMTHRINFKEGN